MPITQRLTNDGLHKPTEQTSFVANRSIERSERNVTMVKRALMTSIALLSLTAVVSARTSYDPILEGGGGGIGESTTEMKSPLIGEELDKTLRSSLEPEELHDDYFRLIKARMEHEVWQLDERQKYTPGPTE